MKATLRTIGGAALAAIAYPALLLWLAVVVRPWQELQSTRRNGMWATLLSGTVHAVVVVLLGLVLLPKEALQPISSRPLSLWTVAAENEIDVSLEKPLSAEREQEIKAGADDPEAAPFELAGGGEGAPVSDSPLVVDFHVQQPGTGFSTFKGEGKGLGRDVGERYSGNGEAEEGAGQGDAGDGNKTTFFGSTATGRRFVFIVDSSGSMEVLRFARARAELLRSLKEMKPSQEYYVIFYNSNTYPMCDNSGRPIPDLIPATEENFAHVYNWISQAQANGGTNPLQAMHLAERLAPDAIFLLTDGQFVNAFQIGQYLDTLQQPRIPIHTISFIERSGELVLTQIARMTGGRYKHVD